MVRLSVPTDKKVTAPTVAMSSSRPVFSLSDTLARLSKAEEPEAATEPANKGPPETAEEKRKRLRKEQRRKLRVTFKPDDSLVEIQLFTQDATEEVGREDNLLRDAGDAMEEGRMFKQHIEKEEADVDEDEEVQEREQTLGLFEEPPGQYMPISSHDQD